MPTRTDYKAKGYTDQQINDALLQKNLTQGGGTGIEGYKAPEVPQIPINAQSATGVQINTDVMKQYNPNYNPNVGSGVSGVTGTPSTLVKPTPTQINTSNPELQNDINQVNKQESDFNKATNQYNAIASSQPPTQVEKTTTTTPEGTTTVKKEKPGTPVVDTNVGVGREQEILKHLNEGFSASPDLFQDQNTFRTAYGYETADATKKKMLDAFFQAKSSQQNNPDALFQQIATNQPIYNPNIKATPAYQKALSRFNDMNLNAGLTANELADKLRNGSITIGSQAYTDLQMKNPALIQNAERLNSINTGTGNKKIDTNTVESNVSENIIKDMPKEDIPNYQKMLASNPQVASALEKKNKSETRMNTLQDSLDNLEADIRKQYEGTGATEGYIQALISEKAKPIVRELSTLGRQYSSELANLQYYSGIVKDDYETAKEERKTASDRAYEATKDAREFAQQKELAQYQQDLQLQGNQAEFDQKIKQQAQLANDPYTAISTVMDEYKKLGVPFTQSIQTKIADAQKFIAGGGTIAGYVDKMIGDIQAKPEYKAIQEKKDKEKLISVGKDSYLYDPATGTFKSPSQSTAGSVAFTGMNTDLRNSEYVKKYPNEASFKNNNPAGITWNANFDNGTGIAKALQDAGITYSKGTARPALEGGNYVQFDNIGDGMKARQVVFSTTYGDKDLSQALQSWKEGSRRNSGTQQYADSIMKEAGINPNQSITYNSLSQEQRDALTLAQIKRESGGLYKVLTQTPISEGEVMGSAGVPLSYQRRIEQMVPVQLRNSDAESKKLLADIQNMQKAGLSPEDATLMYLGFNVTDPNSKSEAMKLVSQARGLGESLPEDFFIKLSDYVNNGNIAGAKSFTDRVVEGTIKKQVGEDFVSTPNLKFAESTLSRVENLINRNKDKIGPLSGRIADVEKTLMNDPDYQALKTLLSGSLADTRRAFGGTAVSQSELQALKDFIGLNTNMPIENLLSGLRTNLATLKDKYQQQRGFYLGEEEQVQSELAQYTAPVKSTKAPTYQDFYN